MKVAAAVALLPLLAAAAPTAPVHQQEERTLILGLLGKLLGGGGIFSGWKHNQAVGQPIGTCSAGEVTYHGYHNHREWYRWGHGNPAPIAYCVGPAYRGRREAEAEASDLTVRTPEEKRILLSLGLLLIDRLKNKRVDCYDGNYQGQIIGGQWIRLHGNGPWHLHGKTYYWHKMINNIPYYRCQEDNGIYPWYPCQGEQDPGVTIDPNEDDGLCNVCNADSLD
jgi:hypothetical protein